jgi:hypothetical protein
MRRISGVFKETTNRRAFLDRIVLSINGKKRTSPGAGIGEVVNRPIGGVGRNYAREEKGVLCGSGNPCELLYGRMRLVTILPPMVMTIRSDTSPITAKDIVTAINAVAEKSWKASVSYVELTFDFRGVDIEQFRRSAFSSAHRFKPLRDAEGRKTYYIGGSTSPLQVCIYQKTRAVVRLEFKLRRPFLRKNGINSVAELEKLRGLDRQDWLWFRDVHGPAFRSLQAKVRKGDSDDVRQRILMQWFRDFRLREAVQVAKKHFGANPKKLTKRSELDRRITKMQKYLIL